MRQSRRAAALLLAAALCIGVLAGCGESGQKASGLNFSAALEGRLATLDPIRAVSQTDQTVIEHLYENLMRTAANNDGGTDVVDGLAKSYSAEENYDGSVTYTFRLRSAKWSDGVAVTAGDFVYAWQRLANPASNAPNAPILSVVAGYDEVRSTGDVTKLQVEAKNDSTLVVTLTGACPWFLTDICTAAATMPLREDVVQALKAAAAKKNQAAAEGAARATWCSDPAELVTNGPYVAARYDAADGLVLEANSLYTGMSGGPDSIVLRFMASAADAWALYEAEEVDFAAPLPEEALAEKAADKNWSALPELNTGVLLFNTAADPFSDPLTRQAFSGAIDRTALSRAISVVASPAGGLVPNGVPGADAEEDFRTAGGDLVDCDPDHYAANCAAARSKLDQAGYGEGGGFPAVTLLYRSDEASAKTAAYALARMWSDVLQIKVTPEARDEAGMNSALESGDYTLALENLRGYANDAESFLRAWRSDDSRNVVRYYNSAFDTLLSVIDSANDETARMGCLHDAESLLLEDCPLTPLYFTATAWKLRDGLTGVCRDPRGWYSFAAVAAVGEG